MAETPDRELEGWKDISAALGTSIRAAQRYARAGTKTRLPLPVAPNFRSRRSCMESTVKAWKVGGVYLRVEEPSVDQAAITKRPGALVAA